MISYFSVFVWPCVLSYTLTFLLNTDYILRKYAEYMKDKPEGSTLSIFISNVKINIVIMLSFYIGVGFIASLLMFINAAFVGSTMRTLHKWLGIRTVLALMFGHGILELMALSLVYYGSSTNQITIIGIGIVCGFIAAVLEVNYTNSIVINQISKDDLKAFKSEFNFKLEEEQTDESL